jgi:anti-sigma factor RsiW
MAPEPLDREHAIALYLAGQLPPAEREAFERDLPENAELRDQIELFLKLKEGLARLSERGELAALLRKPARPSWLPYATAATVTMLFLAALAWLYRPGAPSNVLAMSPQQFVAADHPPPAIGASDVLARLRDGVAVTELKRAGVIELRVVASVPSVRYRAQVRARGGVTGGRILGQLDTGPSGPDGYVTFYLDSGQLAPGDYEISLSPLMTASPEPPADRFSIRLR